MFDAKQPDDEKETNINMEEIERKFKNLTTYSQDDPGTDQEVDSDGENYEENESSEDESENPSSEEENESSEDESENSSSEVEDLIERGPIRNRFNANCHPYDYKVSFLLNRNFI